MFDDQNSAFFQKFRTIVTNIFSEDMLQHSYSTNIIEQFHLQLRASVLVGTIEWWIENNLPMSVEEISENVLDIFNKLDSSSYMGISK